MLPEEGNERNEIKYIAECKKVTPISEISQAGILGCNLLAYLHSNSNNNNNNNKTDRHNRL